MLQDHASHRNEVVVHSRKMPVRRGHQVTALLLGERLIGLHNASAGKQVNFLRADPTLLWRRCDAVVVAALSFASIAVCACSAWPALLIGMPITFLYPLLIVMARFAWRCRTRAQVDGALNIVKDDEVALPILRRVK